MDVVRLMYTEHILQTLCENNMSSLYIYIKLFDSWHINVWHICVCVNHWQ